MQIRLISVISVLFLLISHLQILIRKTHSFVQLFRWIIRFYVKCNIAFGSVLYVLHQFPAKALPAGTFMHSYVHQNIFWNVALHAGVIEHYSAFYSFPFMRQGDGPSSLKNIIEALHDVLPFVAILIQMFKEKIGHAIFRKSCMRSILTLYSRNFHIQFFRFEIMRYTIKDIKMPKMLASMSHGKCTISFLLKISKINVVDPPETIAAMAATGSFFLKNKAAISGIKSPETMKEYDSSIKSSTLVITVASSRAKAPITKVATCEYFKSFSSLIGSTFDNISVTTLPLAAIRQLSA